VCAERQKNKEQKKKQKKGVNLCREECDKEAFEGSSQLLPSEPLRYLNLACLPSTSL